MSLQTGMGVPGLHVFLLGWGGVYDIRPGVYGFGLKTFRV